MLTVAFVRGVSFGLLPLGGAWRSHGGIDMLNMYVPLISGGSGKFSQVDRAWPNPPTVSLRTCKSTTTTLTPCIRRYRSYFRA